TLTIGRCLASCFRPQKLSRWPGRPQLPNLGLVAGQCVGIPNADASLEQQVRRWQWGTERLDEHMQRLDGLVQDHLVRDRQQGEQYRRLRWPAARVVVVADGHGSRFSSETRDTAAALGFDMLIPGQCTHFLQPWDQLFSSVKASHGKMVAGAAFHAGAEGFSPKLPQRISMVDSALHLSVGHSREPLKRAFAKTGLFPPNTKQMLEAAASSIKSGKQKTTHAAWKVLDVSPELVQAAVQRSAMAQPLLYDRAVDRFYNKHELGGLVAERGAKSGRSRK
ncbi:hypothetical protein QJQ45_027733, partial [Haematococcus lacustris]